VIDKSAGAALRATKMLIDVLEDIEKEGRSGIAARCIPVRAGGFDRGLNPASRELS
jgi:hypothetical protein